ncbi:hypothetical protein ACOSP7_024897 [Xanthoceras sorbifolium]
MQLLLPAGDVLAWSSSFLAEFQAAGIRPPEIAHPPRPVIFLSLPSSSAFKLNVDASIAVSARLVSLRLAIMDNLGRVKASGSVKVATFFNPLLAEAIAVLYGIQLAIDLGFSPLLMESDTLGVINILKEGLIPCLDLGMIILDIFQFCLCSNVLSFSVIPRTTNKVVDTRTKAAILYDLDRFWFEVYPHLVKLFV